MKNKKPFHPALIVGVALFGLFLLRGCAEEFAMPGVYAPAQMMPGTYANYAPQSGQMSTAQWQTSAPPATNMGGDNSYINRSMSGVTVGGDGNGNFYVNDSATSSSVANDGN
jgi:hypothetical protein